MPSQVAPVMFYYGKRSSSALQFSSWIGRHSTVDHHGIRPVVESTNFGTNPKLRWRLADVYIGRTMKVNSCRIFYSHTMSISIISEYHLTFDRPPTVCMDYSCICIWMYPRCVSIHELTVEIPRLGYSFIGQLKWLWSDVEFIGRWQLPTIISIKHHNSLGAHKEPRL